MTSQRVTVKIPFARPGRGSHIDPHRSRDGVRMKSPASDQGPVLPGHGRPTRSSASPGSLGRDRSAETTDRASPTVARCPRQSVSRDIGARPWGPRACADHRRGGQRYGDLHTTGRAGTLPRRRFMCRRWNRRRLSTPSRARHPGRLAAGASARAPGAKTGVTDVPGPGQRGPTSDYPCPFRPSRVRSAHERPRSRPRGGLSPRAVGASRATSHRL